MAKSTHTPWNPMADMPAAIQFQALKADIKKVIRERGPLRNQLFIRSHFYFRLVDAKAKQEA